MKNNESYITPANLLLPGLRAFFTTRILTAETEDIVEAVSKNSDISKLDIYLPIQKHTADVHVLGDDIQPVISDAVITDRRKILIGIRVADCIPVLLFDLKAGIIAAVHAGWRGTAAHILINTIEKMQTTFNCSPRDISVAIGPGIGICSYEVNQEVKDQVVKASGSGDYFRQKGEKFHIDLKEANRLQALNSGIQKDRIWISDECTYCNPDKYYSYRLDNTISGRQGGFIGIW
ncbi:MAG: peptidoglycan editing factor PgeF [Nitrospira sp.]|nr:peptidoglycan editing factor PgeF [bacterium]MBL7031727.1 peptidoglycan editing factor PgeF [Nitrospira sp.]